MSNSGLPRHAASNGIAQAIRGGEGSVSNAVRYCSGKVTGTTTLQLLPARSMGSSASPLMAISSATAPGTTTRSLVGDFRQPDCTRSHKYLGSTWTQRGDVLYSPTWMQWVRHARCGVNEAAGVHHF